MNITQLENKIRDIAARNPDFVYRNINGCKYIDGDEPGCIVERALLELNPNLKDLLKAVDNLDKSQCKAYRKLGPFLGLNSDWINEVQFRQDHRFTWQESVDLADEKFNICRAYKIVRKNINNLVSFSYVDNIYALKYIPGVPTKPDFGKIFVFRHLIHARKFLYNIFCSNAEIWDCECDELSILPHMVECWRVRKILWDVQEKWCIPTPDGTRGCNSCTLLRKVN